MKLYFVRHGESTANLLGEFSNDNNRHPLTELGIEQANAIASQLRSIPINRIYTSPLLRALQTAQILSSVLRTPLEITEALREWSVGIYEGTSNPLGWELHRQVQEDWAVNDKPDSRMPGGESFRHIQERFVPFINELLKNGYGSEQNIILVGHGGLFMTMLPVIFCNVDYAFARKHGLSHASSVIAELITGELHCLSWCGVRIDV
jgi:broad specificity phosphatase PhoE